MRNFDKICILKMQYFYDRIYNTLRSWWSSAGHEALHLFKFVWKFSAICVSIFPFDIIISWDIRVRVISFDWIFQFNVVVLYYSFVCPTRNFLFDCQVHIHGIWHCNGTTQLVAYWIYLFFNCILLMPVFTKVNLLLCF